MSEGEAGSQAPLRAARVRKRWIALARAAVTLGVLAFLVRWVSWDALLEAMRRAPASLWLAVLGGLLLGHLVAAMKWRLFLATAGAACDRLAALRAHGAGLFANLCLPSLVGGDVVRAGMLARSVPAAPLAVGSVADRVVDTAALLALACAGALLTPGLLPGSARTVLGVVAALLALGGVGGLVALRALPLERLPGKLRGPAAKLRDAADACLRRPAAAALGFALALCVQTFFVALNASLGAAIGIDLPFSTWLLAWPLAKLVALAPVSLGGIGVREAALASLLAPFGVQGALAVGQSLLWEAALIALGLLAGALAFGSGRFLGGDPAPAAGGAA